MEIEAAFEGVDSSVKLYRRVSDRVSHAGCASEPYKTRGEDAEVARFAPPFSVSHVFTLKPSDLTVESLMSSKVAVRVDPVVWCNGSGRPLNNLEP